MNIAVYYELESAMGNPVRHSVVAKSWAEVDLYCKRIEEVGYKFIKTNVIDKEFEPKHGTSYLVYHIVWDGNKKKITAEEFGSLEMAQKYSQGLDTVNTIREFKF